ncbi:hypothetical protein [Thalassotalea sp. PLHSN55]|uniref:hypothetical protein n=1 Tax=Thalassotalea sp. PLHSN55 TaxID=3435888 RepID=UPI003F872DF6
MRLTQHLNQGSLLYFDQQHEKLSVSQNNHYRWLAFDNVIQSVMSRRLPNKLTLPHHSALLLPLIFFKPKSLLEFGLGGGNIARFMHGLNESIDFTSIERSPRVVEAFKQFFNPDAIKINIISDEDISQSKRLQKRANQWLIYDIYRAENGALNYCDKQLLKLVNQLSASACLSINLVDISDEHINRLLMDLTSQLSNHTLSYFNVPHYQNVIVHILPQHFTHTNEIINSNSYLSERLQQRWLKFWQHGHHSSIHN